MKGKKLNQNGSKGGAAATDSEVAETSQKMTKQ